MQPGASGVIDGAYDMVRFQQIAKYGRDADVEFGPVYIALKKGVGMQGPVLIGVHVDYRDNHKLMENGSSERNIL